MRAAVYTQVGGPEVVKIVENAPRPIPRPDEVLIKVAAASVNPLDTKIRSGHFPAFIVRGGGGSWPPSGASFFVPGADVAGVVESAPAGSKFTKGQRVVAFTDKFGSGSFAQYMALPAAIVAALPDNVSMTDGAAVPLAGVTALQLLNKLGRGPPPPGATLLVNGGAGGVGSLLVQLAAARGYKVTATASAKNADQVISLGATEALDYAKQPDYEAYATKAGGFDGIIDTVGSSTRGPRRDALKRRGLFVRLGTAFSLPLFLNAATGALKRLLFLGPRYTVFSFVSPNGDDLAQLIGAVSKGTVKAQVDKVFNGLEQAAAAQQHAETGRPRGKVVLVIDRTIN